MIMFALEDILNSNSTYVKDNLDNIYKDPKRAVICLTFLMEKHLMESILEPKIFRNCSLLIIHLAERFDTNNDYLHYLMTKIYNNAINQGKPHPAYEELIFFLFDAGVTFLPEHKELFVKVLKENVYLNRSIDDMVAHFQVAIATSKTSGYYWFLKIFNNVDDYSSFSGIKGRDESILFTEYNKKKLLALSLISHPIAHDVMIYVILLKNFLELKQYAIELIVDKINQNTFLGDKFLLWVAFNFVSDDKINKYKKQLENLILSNNIKNKVVGNSDVENWYFLKKDNKFKDYTILTKEDLSYYKNAISLGIRTDSPNVVGYCCFFEEIEGDEFNKFIKKTQPDCLVSAETFFKDFSNCLSKEVELSEPLDVLHFIKQMGLSERLFLARHSLDMPQRVLENTVVN